MTPPKTQEEAWAELRAEIRAAFERAMKRIAPQIRALASLFPVPGPGRLGVEESGCRASHDCLVETLDALDGDLRRFLLAPLSRCPECGAAL